MALDALWSESFPTRPRPQVYSSQDIAGDGYLPLTDTSDFLVDGLHSLSASQLYTLTANNAEALRQAQEEWTNLERLAAQLKTQDHFSTTYKDPQALPSHEIFDERKEATLYNYKYEGSRPMIQAKFTIPSGPTDQEKFDLRESPNPFAQRIPNDKQYRAIMATARAEGREKNPDNQTPYEENFAFHSRPPGTWVPKMAPTEAVQPPRTRAREAQLNGTLADRQTRFNGEKVPLTRGVASADEMASQDATPIGSPASRKRRIDTIDITLPRKKHPNQHTKRREREEAERLATLNQQAPFTASQTDSAASPIPTPKKKHPNQYTKRREREEAERLFREQQGEREREVHDYFESLGSQSPAIPRMVSQPYVEQPHIPPKRKHPNQYTKRREQEEAEKLADIENWYQDHNDRDRREMSLYRGDKTTDNLELAPRHSTPASPRPQPQNHPSRNIDFSKMSTVELRTFTFKDWELTTLLQDRYLWLNDDPVLAKQWKIKIENSAYAMRTYAMLKKWKEWASEGRDKRPRDKDKHKTRGKNESHTRLDGEEADVESMADDPNDNTADPTYHDTNGRPNSRIVTLKRPVRTRSSRLPFEGGESPKVMPSSPLVNGVNARDLDKFDKMNDQAKVHSFTSTLQTIGEVDNATKVDRWQADTVPSSTADDEQRNDATPKSSTPQPTPTRLIIHGTEDDMYPSTQSTLQPDDMSLPQQDMTAPADDKMEVDSEDPLALQTNNHVDRSVRLTEDTQDNKNPWIPNTKVFHLSKWDPSEEADTIMVHEPAEIKVEDPSNHSQPHMSRTRSQRSIRSTTMNTSQSTSPNKRQQVPSQFQAQAPPTTRPRLTRGVSSTNANNATYTNANTNTNTNVINAFVPQKAPRRVPSPVRAPSTVTSTESVPVSPVVTNGSLNVGVTTTTTTAGGSGGGRRAGLRPNPVKRTLTAESLKSAEGSGGGNGPVRRSLRGSGFV